jgi:phosphoglucosamine mutase
VDGDAILYLAAVDMQKRGLLKENTVVATVMSNIGLKIALKKQNIRVKEVQVGDKYVQACLKEQNLPLGGEQSGHIIFLQDLNTGDGLLTAIKIMNILVSTGKSLEELLTDLKIYPQSLKNVTVTNKDAILAHAGLQNLIEELEATLGDTGRILVRASGTESLVRVMAEAPTFEECDRVVSALVNYINEISY